MSDMQAVKSFARAHIELRRSKDRAAQLTRANVASARDLGHQITEILLANDGAVSIGQNQVAKLKYNRSVRSVSYQILREVVGGLSDEELRADKSALVRLLCDRIHVRRTKTNATFHVAPGVGKDDARAAALYDDMCKLRHRISEVHAQTQPRICELKTVIANATASVDEAMKIKALQAGGRPEPIRVDVPNGDTYFVRSKPVAAPIRAETKKEIGEVLTAALDSETSLSREQLLYQVSGGFVSAKREKKQAANALRYTLDKSTKRRRE